MTKPPLLRSPAEFADARARNEAIWNPSVEHYNAMRIDEALEYWHEESRWITAFPVAGMPRMVDSRAEMARVWRTLYVDTERVEVENVRFHQTDDPDVAFVEERFTAYLANGGLYVSDLVMRVTFRDGLISEVVEYFDPAEQERLVRRVGLGS